MRCLCFGGSFNPVHHGHLLCARAVAEAGGFDRVVLIPSAQPPHKPAAVDLAPAEHRLEMCRLAAALQSDLFDVDDLELRRTGRSYTMDTVRQLKQRGWEQVHWLIGADMLQILPSWYQPDALLRETHFAIMARPGWNFAWDKLPKAYQALQQNVYPAPLIDISATDIRRRIAAGKPIQFLTPQPVVQYIQSHRLYR